jgi:MFS family permease
VQKDHWWREYTELAGLMFIHAMAMGMWFVPLGSVLDAHGYHGVKAFAFATSGLAAFVSPLMFGALADQRFSPVRILRWLAVATAVALTLAATAIEMKWPAAVLLGLVQLYALCAAPTWGITTTIVLSRLSDAKREFGPLRAMATVGWMVGCWFISWVAWDRSPHTGYGAAAVWLGVAAFTFALPSVAPPAPAPHRSWKQRLGLDAISLLRNKDHRVVFVTAALFNIPLCAFYPFTPAHLQELGFERPAAWMTLGQVTEIAAMFLLAGVLARWRLKTIFLTGIGFGVLRYVACAFDASGALLTGIALHGFAFTLFFITAQIYLEQRIDPAWRARAQALLTLMMGGLGNTLGYLGCGGWFQVCAGEKWTMVPVFGPLVQVPMRVLPDWSLYWGGLAAVVALIWIWFAWTYTGRKHA